MDQILDIYILSELKDTGYSFANKRALQILKSVFIKKMLTYCKSLKHVTNHAGRHKTILTDIFNFDKSPMFEINNSSKVALHFENSIYTPPEKFVNEIASKIDRYIHIYEFMPEFPPTHTFKRSYAKNAKKHDIKIKQRVEQNLLAERTVFKMVFVEKKMPRHVNYMDYMEQ